MIDALFLPWAKMFLSSIKYGHNLTANIGFTRKSAYCWVNFVIRHTWQELVRINTIIGVAQSSSSHGNDYQSPIVFQHNLKVRYLKAPPLLYHRMYRQYYVIFLCIYGHK